MVFILLMAHGFNENPVLIQLVYSSSFIIWLYISKELDWNCIFLNLCILEKIKKLICVHSVVLISILAALVLAPRAAIPVGLCSGCYQWYIYHWLERALVDGNRRHFRLWTLPWFYFNSLFFLVSEWYVV